MKKMLLALFLLPIYSWAQDYDVRAFGAKVDGVTDDFAALQAAAHAAVIGRGTVVIPNGTLYVDLRGQSSISLSRGVRICGLGRTSIIRTNRAAPTESKGIFYIEPGDTAYFNDLSFVGPDSSGAWESQAIHHAGGSSGLIRLDNVYVEGFTTGVKSQEGTTSILVYDSEFAHCGWCIMFKGELHGRVLISGCIFRDTRPQTQMYRPFLWHGIYIQRHCDVTVIRSRFLRITGIGVVLDEDGSLTNPGGSHVISDCDFDTMRVGILSGSVYGPIDTITNCRFTACSSGIRIWQGDADISFCEFHTNYAGSEGGCGGIHPQTDAPGNISVSHSTFYLPTSDPSAAGVFLSGTTPCVWKVSSSSFIGSGGQYGSGVQNHSDAGSILLTKCQFTGTFSSSYSQGAILNQGGTISVDSSIFDIVGSVVRVYPPNTNMTTTTLTHVDVSNSTKFIDVFAPIQGGVINISGEGNFATTGQEFSDGVNSPECIRNYQLSNRPGFGGIIQSANTITLSRNYDTWRVQGRSIISTINMAGTYYASEFGPCKISLVADSSFSLGSEGNIVPFTTAPRSVGEVVNLEYDTADKKWKEQRNDTGMHSAPQIEPRGYVLSQNFPNPFNPTTSIEYSIPQAAYVLLEIFNSLGQHVITLISGEVSAGSHKAVWDATAHPSGTYMCRLQTSNFRANRKLLLLK